MIGIVAESALSHTFDDTSRSESLSVVDFVFLIIAVFKCGAEQHAQKAFEPLPRVNFDLKAI